MWKWVCSAGRIGLLIALPVQADAIKEIESGGYRYFLGPQPAWVRSVEVPAGAASLPGESVHYRLIDTQHRINGSDSATYRRVAMGLLTEQGVVDAAQLPIDFDPTYQRLVLHTLEVEREGTREDRIASADITMSRRERQFEAGFFTGVVSMLVIVEDVRVGDTLHFAYTIEGANPVYAELAGYRYAHHYRSPVSRSSVRLLIPPGRTVQLGGSALDRVLTRRLEDGTQEILWSEDDVEAERTPLDTPGWYEPVSVLEATQAPDWATVVRWGLDLYAEPLAARGTTDELARGLVAGAEDDEKRILALLRFVQDEIRYFAVLLGDSTHRPSLPSEVVQRRFGDCKDKSALLVSLLRSQGFQAWPAMVSTVRRRGVQDGLPGSHAFDHVIVLLEWDGRRYWLDPTSNYQRGGLAALGFPDLERALPIRPDQRALEPMVAPEDAIASLLVEETMEPGETAPEMRLTVRTTATRELAEHYRRTFAGSSLSEVAEGFVDYYSRLYGSVYALADMEINDDEANNRIVFVERYRVADFWSKPVSQYRYVDLVATGIVHSLPEIGRADRNAPQILGSRSEWRHHVNVVLPDGWRWQQVPEKEEHDVATIEYKRGVRTRDQRLEIEHRYSNRTRVVALEDWPQHLIALRSIRDAVHTRLIVHDPTPPAATRQERLRDLIRSGR